MKLGKKDLKMLSQSLMTLSGVAVFFAAVGYLGTDIWLASTQWLLVAAVMALFGLYGKLGE